MTDQQSPKPRRRSNTPMYIIIASIAMAVGVWVSGQIQSRDSGYVQIEAGTVLPQTKPMPAFKLVDHDGKPFTPDRFKDRWTFVFFGYTFCPDICPTTLATFKQVRNLIAETDLGLKDVEFVFVSVDPDRDTPERLKQYVQFFSEDFTGVTGETEQLDVLVRASGAVYMKVPGKDENSYLVDHSASVFVMGPQGGLKALLRAPHDPQKVVSGFEKMRAARG